MKVNFFDGRWFGDALWSLHSLLGIKTPSVCDVPALEAQQVFTDSQVVFLCSVRGQRNHATIMCALILLHK